MSRDIKAYRVFIASPSGLDAERRRFRATLTEYNEDEAVERGVSFWPNGWQDTLAGVGRPQSLINEDLRRCDYFVLVLCDRWGQPTSTGAGRFTAGTEEEYYIARECLLDPASPMRGIVILFKGVTDRQMSDPGEQLRKVIAFRRKIESEKELLYQTFDVEEEFARIMRRHLAQWIRDHESQKPAKPISVPAIHSTEQDRASKTYPSIDAMVADAEDLAANGRAVEAEELFAKAVVGSRSVQARLKYAKFLRRSDRLAYAKANYQSALDLANEQQDEKSAVEALANLGLIERRQNNLKEAEQYLLNAQSRLSGTTEEWQVLRGFVLGNLAHVYSDQKQLDKAEALQRQALDACAQLSGHEEEIANSYGTLGVILRRGKRWASAEDAHREGIRLSEVLGDRGAKTLAYNCGSLGLVLERTGRYKEAVAMHERALHINEKRHWEEGQALNLGHLASALVACGTTRLDEAATHNEAAFTLNSRRGNPEGLAFNYSTKGRISELRREFNDASKYYQAASDLFRQIKKYSGVAHNLRNLARVLSETDRSSEAELILQQAEEIAGFASDLDLRGEIREERARLGGILTDTLPAVPGPASAAN